MSTGEPSGDDKVGEEMAKSTTLRGVLKGNCETREDLLQNVHGLNTDSNSIISLSKYNINVTFFDEKKLQLYRYQHR